MSKPARILTVEEVRGVDGRFGIARARDLKASHEALRSLAHDLASCILQYDRFGKGRPDGVGEVMDRAEACGVLPPPKVDEEERYRPSTRPGGQGE